MKYTGKNGESFEVVDIDASNCNILKTSGENELSLLWFNTDDNRMRIDSEPYTFNQHDIAFLTEFHRVETEQIKGLKLLRFNKPFYCILDHDSEVSCKGILYYGASMLPKLHIPDSDQEIMEAVWKVLIMELESRDELQLEMLQMMLKRILILCTRIYKIQLDIEEVPTPNMDIIREFNFLVEQHFREQHSVSAYAEMLHKSPKTLSNLFKKMSDKTPLQFIQNRLMLEARRMLKYSEKPVSEIGYDLGFGDVQSFSRFFKTKAGVSPNDFRLSA